jgi:hypothetical protein
MSWIKMRTNLWDDPRVLALCDATDTQEAMIIGGLYWLWTMADQHTTDGVLLGLSLRQIDRKTGISGFGEALGSIGWVTPVEGGVRIERFTEHNGTGTKQRLETAARVAKHRAKGSSSGGDNGPVTPTEGGCNASALPREEKSLSVPKGTGGASPPPAAQPDEPPPFEVVDLFGAKPPAPAPAPPTQGETIFALGVPLLTAAGVSERNARSMLGHQRKTHGDDAVVNALRRCAEQSPLEPVAWLQAALKAKPAAGAAPAGSFTAVRTAEVAAWFGSARVPGMPGVPHNVIDMETHNGPRLASR